MTQFFVPAENALLPQLASEDRLLAANSLNSLNNNLARLLGPPIGGLLAEMAGLWGVVIVDAASYLVAGAMIGLISVTSRPAARTIVDAAPTVASSLGRVWREWVGGLRIVRRERTVTVLFVIAAATALGEGILGVLFVPLVTEVLRGDGLDLGWLMTAQAVGGLLGGVLGEVVGIVPMLTVDGGLYVLAGVVALTLLPRAARHAPEPAQEPTEQPAGRT